jgi:hypothetical protein
MRIFNNALIPELKQSFLNMFTINSKYSPLSRHSMFHSIPRVHKLNRNQNKECKYKEFHYYRPYLS